MCSPFLDVDGKRSTTECLDFTQDSRDNYLNNCIVVLGGRSENRCPCGDGEQALITAIFFEEFSEQVRAAGFLFLANPSLLWYSVS